VFKRPGRPTLPLLASDEPDAFRTLGLRTKAPIGSTADELALRLGVTLTPLRPDVRIAISNDLASKPSELNWPLNGYREPPWDDMAGWFIWTGGHGLPIGDDAFTSLHAAHAEDYIAEAIPYLGLPAGWRFLVAPGHEDVWFDEELLSAD